MPSYPRIYTYIYTFFSRAISTGSGGGFARLGHALKSGQCKLSTFRLKTSDIKENSVINLPNRPFPLKMRDLLGSVRGDDPRSDVVASF
jgi:hypothetical protein